MANQQLIDYIKQQLQQGVNRKDLKNSLVAAGWKEEYLEEAFQVVSASAGKSSSAPTTPRVFPLPGFMALLVSSWMIYRQRFGTFVGIVVIPALVMVPLVAILLGGGFLSFTLLSSRISETGVGAIVLLSVIFAIVAFVFLSIIALLIPVWGLAALVCAIRESDVGIGVKESYSKGWHKMLSCWWILLLLFLITIGGFLFFVIPGIVFPVWFSVAVFVLISEDLKGMDALLKSKEYVRGRWDGVFWRLLFVTGISGVVLWISASIFGVLSVSFGRIVSFILSIFVFPFVTIYLFLVYGHLKSLRGKFAFEPTGKSRFILSLFAILIFLVVPVMIFLNTSPSVNAARAEARDNSREVDVDNIRKNLELYYGENNAYPTYLEYLVPEYVEEVPIDQKTGLPHEYRSRFEGEDYQLCVRFEQRERECFGALEESEDVVAPTAARVTVPVKTPTE